MRCHQLIVSKPIYESRHVDEDILLPVPQTYKPLKKDEFVTEVGWRLSGSRITKIFVASKSISNQMQLDEELTHGSISLTNTSCSRGGVVGTRGFYFGPVVHSSVIYK